MQVVILDDVYLIFPDYIMTTKLTIIYHRVTYFQGDKILRIARKLPYIEIFEDKHICAKVFEDKYFQGSINIHKILENFYPQKYVALR